MTEIAEGQLRAWAHNIRQAADDLFPPGELLSSPGADDLLAAGHAAAVHRLVARDNLYSIAAALEEAADS